MDEITSLEEQIEQLEQHNDAKLGAYFRRYIRGLSDTQLEGFSRDQQFTIISLLRDMNLAIEAGL